MKKLGLGIIIVIIFIGCYFFFNLSTSKEKTEALETAYKNISYTILGKSVTLENGVAETEATSDSATKTITRYFGNELKADLDGDGLEDVAFIITQNNGGSGIFFYAVAARNTGSGYAGSDAYLLGDRIAPQSTTLSQNPKHKHVIVFNYADRAKDEPMTALPSLNKSVYLKINPITMHWETISSDFESN